MTVRLLQDTNSWFQSVRHFRSDHEIVPLKPRRDPPKAAAKLHKATRRLSFMQRMSRDMRRRKSIDESAETNQNLQVWRAAVGLMVRSVFLESLAQTVGCFVVSSLAPLYVLHCTGSHSSPPV